MAIHVAVELRKKPNKDGLYPLAIRITTNRVQKYSQIGPYIKLTDWNNKKRIVKQSHPDANSLNLLIAESILETRKRLESKKTKDTHITITKTKKKISKPNKKPTFFEFAQLHLDELEALNKFSRLSTNSAYLNYIKSYHKQEDLLFKDIDEHFLRKLKIHLKKNRSLSEISALNIMVFIRTLYNRAINQKIVKKKFYPFGKDKIRVKFPESRKIGLNKWEVMLLEQLKDLRLGEIHARNVWMYSFNFAGMRVADILKTCWSDFHDGRLYYRMGKNSKLVSLKIPSKVLDILEHYKAEKRHANDFVFPELKKANAEDPKDVYVKIKTANKKLNYHLKKMAEKAGINKPLTMHIARHSFGHVAGDTIHPLKLQKLYRHSDLKTTLNYQANFIHADVDEALDKVVNF
jgi:integrase